MVGDTCQGLLGVCSFFLSSASCLFVKVDDFVAEPHVIDWLLWREEIMLHSVVNVSSLESYPITFPSFSLSRGVSMPFAREQQEDVASFDDGLWAVG